jgi:hypothetical protein
MNKSHLFPGETFGVLKEKETREFGEYRTKRVILELYDAMQDAMRTGKPLRTVTEEGR